VPEYRYDYVIGAPAAHDRVRTAGGHAQHGESRTLVTQAWERAPLPLLRAAGTLVARFV
jgi:hypothetical protein